LSQNFVKIGLFTFIFLISFPFKGRTHSSRQGRGLVSWSSLGPIPNFSFVPITSWTLRKFKKAVARVWVEGARSLNQK